MVGPLVLRDGRRDDALERVLAQPLGIQLVVVGLRLLLLLVAPVRVL